jgi:hypothetical protein
MVLGRPSAVSSRRYGADALTTSDALSIKLQIARFRFGECRDNRTDIRRVSQRSGLASQKFVISFDVLTPSSFAYLAACRQH